MSDRPAPPRPATVAVAGATGRAGRALVAGFLAEGVAVRALARDVQRARAALPVAVSVGRWDGPDGELDQAALQGCDVVVNAVGKREGWARDPGTFHERNVACATALFEAACQAGVPRLVHVSTMDVLDAPPGGTLSEDRVADRPKPTPYQRSKQQAEQALLDLATTGSTDLVLVNPSGIYGPTEPLPGSIEAGLLGPLAAGKLPFLPPGTMSLVFERSFAAGTFLASWRGRPGRRYVLCDATVTVRELAALVVQCAGRRRVPPTLPRGVARALAGVAEGIARVTGAQPMLSRGELQYLAWGARPDTARAVDELGWSPTPLQDGIAETIAALRGTPQAEG